MLEFYKGFKDAVILCTYLAALILLALLVGHIKNGC